jgi:hypothetical protein
MPMFTGLAKKRASIAIAAATVGNNTLIAAVTNPSKKIRVIHANLQFSASCNIAFQSGAGGTALTGSYAVPANGKFHDSLEVGLFETASGALLNLTSDAAVGIGGFIIYETPE